jgi:hypothetical protein
MLAAKSKTAVCFASFVFAAALLLGGCPLDEVAANLGQTIDTQGTDDATGDTISNDQTTVVAMSTWSFVDTNQVDCFDNQGVITCPAIGAAFDGQDSQYAGNPPSYVDNGDGTVTDQVTGLMWQQGFNVVAFADAAATAEVSTLAGYSDWRVPTIKELYSLIDFTGNQGSAPPEMSTPPADAVPFIDTTYFNFEYPSENRYIDAQYISSTEYTAATMGGNATFFGVNFADGRIKGYPQSNPRRSGYYLRLVRGDQYGVNCFVDNGDGTVTDVASGLMWMQVDSGDDSVADAVAGYTYDDGSLNWGEALDFSENLTYASYDDWRLPNAKELQSLVDYTRSPDATGSAAIDPVFDVTQIVNEAGAVDYPFYWSSTSFEPGLDAIYVVFGRGLGYMDLGSGADFYDVHGAGCQRTDPKIGTPSVGHGPQGDVRRVYNYVRCVRDVE